MTRAILMDIGGPILPEDELYALWFSLLFRALHDEGVSLTEEEFQAAIERCIQSFVPNLGRAIAWHFTKPDVAKSERVAAAARSGMGGMERQVRPGIAHALSCLSDSYILALAANAGPAIREALGRDNLLKHFASIEVSGDLPWSKPDPRFFEHILGRIGVPAEEAIMVGDRLDNDIIPAKLLGMKAVHFKVGPYTILEPRTPSEIPDAIVTTPEAMLEAIKGLGLTPPTPWPQRAP